MHSREKIQAKVDTLLKLSSQKEWEEYSIHSALQRKVLYHYTTFKNLKSILESRQWWVGRTDKSNDPVEKEMYCLSFSRGLGTMAMWGNYSQPAGNGVRIKFDLRKNKNFKKIFRVSEDAVGSSTPKLPQGTMYDVVYYHSSPKNGNCLEFDGIILLGTSQPWTVNENDWPYFLKSEIWRDENETRIVYKCNKSHAKYLKIPLDGFDFSKLTFELAPDFLLPNGERPDENMKNMIIQEIFGEKLLDDNKISLTQFVLAPPNSKARLTRSRKNLFKAAIQKIMSK